MISKKTLATFVLFTAILMSSTTVMAQSEASPELQLEFTNDDVNKYDTVDGDELIQDESPETVCYSDVDDVQNMSLYRNGIEVDTTDIGVILEDNSELFQGEYTYWCESEATESYDAGNVSKGITMVDEWPDTVSYSINGSEFKDTIEYNETYVIEFDASSGDAEAYLNGEKINNSHEFIVEDKDYNLEVRGLGSYKYSSNSEIYSLEVLNAPLTLSERIIQVTTWILGAGAIMILVQALGGVKRD